MIFVNFTLFLRKKSNPLQANKQSNSIDAFCELVYQIITLCYYSIILLRRPSLNANSYFAAEYYFTSIEINFCEFYAIFTFL